MIDLLGSATRARHEQKEHEFFIDNLKSKTKRVDYELEAITDKYQKFQQDMEVRAASGVSLRMHAYGAL